MFLQKLRPSGAITHNAAIGTQQRGQSGTSEEHRHCAFSARTAGGAVPVRHQIRRPTPGIASNVAPRGRIRYWSYLEHMAPRQCGTSSKPRAGSRPREVMPVLGCMRSSRGVNERRAERQSCTKTAPTRPQAAPGMAWECGSVQSEQRLRTWPPRHLQLLWGGVGAARGVWEERRARRGAHFVPR